jgi:hypothetical protein
MLRTLKEACDQHGLRHRAVSNRLKKLGYIKTSIHGNGLVPDYGCKATAEHFRLRNQNFYIPGPNGRINKTRTVVAVTDAGEELVCKLCPDLAKPLEQESQAS